jgi:hypothetical protein
MHATIVGNDVVVSIGACVARKIPDGKTTIPKLSKYI